MNKAMKNVLALSLAVISLVSTAGCNMIVTKTDVSEMETRLAALESALASEKATTSALTEKSQLQDEALEALLSANTELSGKINDLTMANGALAEKNEELNGKIDDLTIANGALAEKNQELSESMEQLLAEKEESFAEIEYLKAMYAVSQAYTGTIYYRKEDVEEFGTDLSRYSSRVIKIALKSQYYGMELTKEVFGYENVKSIYDPTKDPDANVDPTQEYVITIHLEITGTVMAQAAVLHCRSLEFVKNAWMTRSGIVLA